MQPTPCWQHHLLRCGSSRAGTRIRRALTPSRKQIFHNLERVTIAPAFYYAFALDTACAGRQAAFVFGKSPRVRNTFLQYKLELPSLQQVCNRHSVGSFICFTFAAHARELSSALCYIEFLFWGHRTVTILNIYIVAPLAPRAQELSSALGWNEFLFWVPKSVTVLGTCFGAYCTHNLFSNTNERGCHFWSPFWEPLLVTALGTHFASFFAKWGNFGNVTARIL